jgi:hypothetical protein
MVQEMPEPDGAHGAHGGQKQRRQQLPILWDEI